MGTDLYLASGAALLVGGLVGWWLKGTRYRTERLILEEHFTRKVRLAENDREQAIRQLNQNQVEMRSWEGRIEGHQAEAERLEQELGTARNQLSALRKIAAQHAQGVAELESRIEDRGGRIEELLKSLAEREAHAAEALRMETEAVSNLEQACALLDQRGGELEELAHGLQAARGETRRVEAELTERVRASDEKRTAIETEWEESERAIHAGWEERHAESLAARQNEKEELERARREEKEELTKRLAALEPLPARVAELQARLEETRSGHEEYAEARREEIGKLETGVAARDELLVELDRERRARTAEREETAIALATSKDEAAARLEKTRAKAARELEAAVARANKELEATRTEAAGRLETEQSQAAKKLQRERTRAETAESRAQGSREKVAERDEEIANQKKHLAALSNSHKAAQLKVDRLQKRSHDLQETLTGRREKLTELQGAHRDRGVELKALSRELKTISAGNAKAPKAKPRSQPRDELQEIAGIGPALETKLRGLGYGSYEKLAVLDRDGVDRLAERLGTSPQRIRRERWVAAAKREHKAKYGRSS